MDRRKSLKLYLLWLKRIRANLVRFNNIITRTTAAQHLVLEMHSNALFQIELFITFSVPRTSVRAKVLIVSYSYLWTKLPQRLRIPSLSCMAFKKEISKVATVPLLIYVYQSCLPEDQAYETGRVF